MWQDDPCDRNSPQSPYVGKLTNQLILTGYLRVYNITAFSSNAASQFVLMFDASSLPADTAVPAMAFPISASSNLGLYYGTGGKIFQRGLVLCTSSTATTKTLNGTADTFFDVTYDVLAPPAATDTGQ